MADNKILSTEALLDNLCFNDTRSPLHDPEDEVMTNCACDNCYYGRHSMANELIMHRQRSHNE